MCRFPKVKYHLFTRFGPDFLEVSQNVVHLSEALAGGGPIEAPGGLLRDNLMYKPVRDAIDEAVGRCRAS